MKNLRRAWRHTALGIAALALGTAAWSATPTDASIEELLEITLGEKMIPGMHANVERSVMQGAKASMGGREPTPEEQHILQAAASALSAALREEVTWERLKPAMLQIYRDSYTQEEVDAQVAFYSSPVGQSIAAKLPDTMQRSAEMSEQFLLPLLPRMIRAAKQAVMEARKTAQDTQQPPATSP